MNRLTMTRSLSAIKYVIYDSKNPVGRAIVTIALVAGVVFFYFGTIRSLINIVVNS